MKTYDNYRYLSIGMQEVILILTFVLGSFMPGCLEIGPELPADDYTENDEGEEYDPAFAEFESSLLLNDPKVLDRCNAVKARAAMKGITNGLIIAGIANHETGMAQCALEYTNGVGCGNVGTSADCSEFVVGVLGGSGDGPCTAKQGGIGMFQLDAGTYTDTFDVYGQSIMTVNGNIDAGVDFVIKKLGFQCPYTPCFDAQNPGASSNNCLASYNDPADVQVALNWFNTAKPGTAAYDTFMTALAACYNGCQPGWTGCGNGSQTHEDIKGFYKAATEQLFSKFGENYWYPGTNSCSNAGTFSGSGVAGGSGTNCLGSYSFPTVAGNSYTISTCSLFTGDPYLKVTGSCTCGNDDSCGLGSQCTCKAMSNGTATICPSTYGSSPASWNYSVSCTPGAVCGGAGPFSGSGSAGGSGTKCLNSYTFNTVAGKQYKISTCGAFTGDPYLKVTGTCSCQKDDACGLGSECTCTATANGPATVCASTYNNAPASWTYNVTCL